MTDIVERLGKACSGWPFAKILWPHRLLHEARDEITSLRRQLAAQTAKSARLTLQVLDATDDADCAALERDMGAVGAKLRPDGEPYRCPYSLNLVAEIAILWPCPSCGARFGSDRRDCLDRVPGADRHRSHRTEVHLRRSR